MPKYVVGQTYPAVLFGGEQRNFTVEEIGAVFYGIRWDDGSEEWAYEKDIDCWVEAAREKEEEEKYS